MRIVFMGTPSYATAILEKLLHVKEFEIVGLFTQMDKPVGRKKVLTPPHVKEFVLKKRCKFPIFQPKNLREDEIVQNIKELNPDFIVVAAYGQILPQNVLDIAPCVNLHASLLPRFRGASPIQSAILKNDRYSGVTAMKMERGLDTGDMLGFSYVKLDEDTTSEELFETLSNVAGDLTIKVLKNFSTLLPLPQSNALSNYAPKITKADGEVDIYTKSASEIYRKYRAYTPWPGVFLPNGIKLIDFSCEESTCSDKLGIISKLQKDEICLTCKGGILAIREVQPPSKQKMSAYSYVQGLRKRVGDRLY